MAKTIIFCADGTWNSPVDTAIAPADVPTPDPILDGDDTKGHDGEGKGATNVFKLFQNLTGDVVAGQDDPRKERERIGVDAEGRRQVAKYIHGIGASQNVVDHVLGGAVGAGLIGRIVRGFTFISRNYEPGDAIHIVGFSRGAYTARALAGMIATVGLLDRQQNDLENRTRAYALGTAAWARAKGLTISGDGIFSRLGNSILAKVGGTFAAVALADRDLVPHVEIESVGVWDTVGAMGIPRYVDDGRRDVLEFTDRSLSPKVKHGFHAMAIDELRRDFPVTRWDPRAGIKQTWFIGAHADVGGGYAESESRLSDIALGWMTKQLAAVGVGLRNPLACVPNPRWVDPAYHEPWEKPPFNWRKTARRVAPTDTVHATVIERWNAAGATPYRPMSMKECEVPGTFVRDDLTYP